MKIQLELENGTSIKNASRIEKQEEEISRLENETKSLIQVVFLDSHKLVRGSVEHSDEG